MANLPPMPPTDGPRESLVSTHRGPTKRSNWVVPGSLLCGDRSSLDSEDGLIAILKAGVTTIVCLQSRQETSVAVDYKKRARSIRDGMKFLEQPIPDQEVTEDVLIEDMIDRLLDLLAQGQVLYVHCRGGHGRTGTICALLLGRLYDLKAPEALARVQLYHDSRQQPVFYAEGYQELPDGSGCVALFPSQRAQVMRFLGAAVPAGPVDLTRAQSSVYGEGASKYDESTMQEWQDLAKAAADMLNAGKKETDESLRHEKLHNAVKLFWTAARLRPDFVRGYIGLSRTLRLLEELAEASHALLQGLERCPEDEALLQELRKLNEAKSTLGEGAGLSSDVVPAGSSTAAGYPSGNPTAVEPVPELTWRPRVVDPRFVMLVGLPGSGKSTFSEQLVKSGRGWERLCQDEMEGRDALENSIGRIAKDAKKRLVIDRTNVVRDDRKAFLSLAFDPKDSVCVYFESSAAECEERVAKRTDHPQIKYGRGRGAVRSMNASFEMPSCEEGFAEVITLCDFRDAAHLLRCWSAEAAVVAPMGFFKFPTTPHVLDLTHGRALTESDRLLTPAEAFQFFDGVTTIIAEEKVDGANLGISLSEHYEPQYQNRSHYVTSSYATQWKALDTWWETNGWAVCQLLVPEVEVLFGEWVWACHSVEYSRLPGYFIAFDIYNKAEGRFVSAAERDRRLDGFGIPVVPRLAERTFHGREDLEQFLTTTSAFGEGFLEGIYLRIDESVEVGGLWLQRRGKVVRADFVQGIEEGGHWMNKEVKRNKLEM